MQLPLAACLQPRQSAVWMTHYTSARATLLVKPHGIKLVRPFAAVRKPRENMIKLRGWRPPFPCTKATIPESFRTAGHSKTSGELRAD